MAVDANNFIAVEARARELGQFAEVYMDVVVGIMPSHVPGKHSGVGCMGIPADEGKADTRHWVHGKALENAYVAVSAANQDNVP
jgi:hypothetical protein